ncbi:biogenesis of lysosome-related organelles complex 1 subunit 5 isoform X1 [Pseudonaja textilis]|uniref:biogenesis of lysosome-related organelles complex 1 subunit 5 isoform X1 n=1 Tax=Pseudonaja textilis TaxID=8673 RepID=UPI000EA8E378|nr:biogenesis of lysosome-related organelles complex 1 subunit 5 isoform X1 [Pseudonaja textilis]
MSSGAPGTLSVNKTAESPVSGSGNKRRDSLGSTSSCPIFKDVGEIYSRLLDHRPVIQGEIRYFIKEFEEKRGLRELRVLENLNNTIFEANDKILPKCEEVMHGNLNEILKRLQVANQMFHTLQQTEQEESQIQHFLPSFPPQLQTEKLRAAEAQCIADWEEFMKEQHRLKTMVNEEHAKATEHLKEQYAALEKDLPKQAL